MPAKPSWRVVFDIAQVWARSNRIIVILALFILFSLVLHAITLFGLLRVRNSTARQLDISADGLARMQQETVIYRFPVDQTVQIDTIVAINRTVAIPVNLTIPISQTVTVPITTPLGSFNVDVPLNISVPISETLSVTIDEDVPVSADVPIHTDIPISIPLGEGQLGDILRQFEAALRMLRASL